MTRQRPAKILITGATGFVGGAVALEYLAMTDAILFCLTRGKSSDEARDRTMGALLAAAHAYGRLDLINEISDRVSGVAGDVCVNHRYYDGLPHSVDLVLHAAASLRFMDEDAVEIRQVNIDGTANIVSLARHLNAERLCHVSTAYVAGKRAGDIDETRLATSLRQFNNQYEASKADGEEIVATSDLDWKIVRPSIIIGHSRTLAATSFTGMYGMLDEVRRFKRKVAERLGSLLQHRGIRLIAEPSMPLNLIPIDYVAQSTATISIADVSANIFHIVNACPPTAGMCLDVGFDLVGLPKPTFVNRPEQLNEIDRRLQTGFYDSYLCSEKRFSVKNTESVCGPGSVDFPIDARMLSDFLAWYMRSGNHRGGRLRL